MDSATAAVVAAIAAAVAAIAAVGSALAACYQIYLSRQDANRRATLEHLRAIDEQIRPLVRYSPEVLEQAVLDTYAKRPADAAACAAYMALLNELELAAFAAERELVDAKLLREYLGTVIRSGTIQLTFLNDLQKCCGDSTVYEHLRTFLVDVQNSNRRRS